MSENANWRGARALIAAVIVLIGLGVFLWLLDKEFVFRGRWSTEIDFIHDSKLIKSLTASAKSFENGSGFAIFKELPASFVIKKRGIFDNLTIKTKFKTSAPIVRAAVVAEKDPWQIKAKTIYNQYLNNLDWFKKEKNDNGGRTSLILWEKEKKYASVEDFLKNPPAPERVLTLNYDWPENNSPLPNYRSRSWPIDYNVSLRGPQTMFVYLKNEELNWRFYFQDVNRHDGADEIIIRLTDSLGQPVLEEKLSDDGEIWGSGKMSPLREFVLRKKLSDGVYKMQISAPDDIFIRHFQTFQQKFVFQYVVYLGDVSGYSRANNLPVYLFGQAKNLTFRAPHQEGRQEIGINNERLAIAKENENYKFKTKDEYAWVSARSDLKIDFDGFFALSPEAFFLPKPLGFEQISDVKQFKTDYILASDYQPSMEGSWLDSEANFALNNVNQKNGLEFFLDTDGAAPLALSKIEVNLDRPPADFKILFDKIAAKIKTRLKNIL